MEKSGLGEIHLEWVEAFFYMIGKYFILIALIPVVLILGSFIIYPFEVINEKIFKLDNPNRSKFVQWLLLIVSLIVTAIPIILIIYLF